MSSPVADNATDDGLLVRIQVEQLLFEEARLLDERNFDAWLDMLSDDFIYWVPCGFGELDPDRRVSIAYDDRKRMEERVWRLQSGLAHSQLPPSRTQHLISNIEVRPNENGTLKVLSALLLAEVRNDVQTLYAGRIEHILQPREQAGWLIAHKTVLLLNSDSALGDLSFIL